jgi:hypothetical protein
LDCDPLPAFGSDRLGFGFQLFGGETIEQRHILQPAAIVVYEQIPHDGATGLLIGIQSSTPDNAAMVLIDHQVGTMSWTHSRDINIVRLLRMLAHLRLGLKPELQVAPEGRPFCSPISRARTVIYCLCVIHGPFPKVRIQVRALFDETP